MKKIPVISKKDVEKCIYGKTIPISEDTRELALQFRPTESLMLVIMERLPKLHTVCVTRGIYAQIGRETLKIMKARGIEIKTTKFATNTNEVSMIENENEV